MQNLKKIGIVVAVLVVVIALAVFFRSYWLPLLNNFLMFLQVQVGFTGNYFQFDAGGSHTY